MAKYIISLFLFFSMSAISIINAQEKKVVLLNLKNGYSVKGEVIEQSDQNIKIKTLSGDLFEYRNDEIESTSNATSSVKNGKIFASNKIIHQVVARGDKYLNVGFGLLKMLPDNNSIKSSFPPIPISFEYILKDDLFEKNGSLGVGGLVGYSSASEKYTYWKHKSSRSIIGARGYIHYALVEKLDTYGGIQVGIRSDFTKIDYDENYYYNNNEKSSEISPALNLFAGCRYFFNNKIAGMAELGWGISIITVGVSVKI